MTVTSDAAQVSRRRLSTLLSALIVTVLALSGPLAVLRPSSAQALQAPVAFTAKDLPTYQTNGIAWSVAATGGRVFVGGSFSSIRPPGAAAGSGEIPRTNFAVFDAATGQPTSCAPTFAFPASPSDATVRALAVSPDGATLYVGGYFSTVNGLSQQHLAALDIASCSMVTTFRPAPNATVRAVVATASAVYYGGGITSVGGVSRARAAAAVAVGSPGSGDLLPWAPAFDLEVRALALKPDGSQVVVGGSFNTVGGVLSHALAVVDASTGATVRTYPGFIEQNSVVKVLATDATGFYTGNEGTGSGVFDGRIAIDWSSLDQRWRDTCLGATQALVVYSSVLYSGSHAHDCGTIGAYPDGARWHFLAEPVSKAELLPWFPNTNDGLGESIGPRGMAVAGTGSEDFLWAVGEFTTVNGVGQQGITRFGQHNTGTAPSIPLPSLSSPHAGQVRVAWRQSLDLDDAELTYRVYRDNGSSPVFTVKGTSWHWSRRQMTFTDSQLLGSTHTYRVTASDSTTTVTTPWRSITVGLGSAYADRVITDGASQFWRYDELSDVYLADAANNNNGTARGISSYQVTPAAIAGDPSRAITLSGNSSTIYGESRFPSPATFSIETWFKTTTTTGGKLIGFGNKQSYPSVSYDKMIYMTDNGRLVFGVAPNAYVALTSSASYNDGQWHHVAGTQGSGGMVLYVDGLRVARNAVTANQNYAGYWRVGGDTISANWPNKPTNTYFTGSLDETAVYPTALSQSTVADHYQIGTGNLLPALPVDLYGRAVIEDDPTLYWRVGEASGSTAVDATGGGLNGVYGSGTTLGTPGALAGVSNTATLFGGGTTGTLTPSSSMPAPSVFTQEAWVKTNTTQGGKIMGFGNLQSGVSTIFDRHVYMRNTGQIVFGVRQGPNYLTLQSPNAYNDNAYHHVVASEGPAGMQLYVDGALVASGSGTGDSSYTAFFRAGGDNLAGWPNLPTSRYLNGTIDEIALYTTQLSAIRVATHYRLGFGSGPDTAVPTKPSPVSAAVTGGDVALSWPASADNVGVIGYNVYRSSAANFIPSAANLVGSPASTGYADPAVGAGTWYYQVIARDAAGNLSTPSNPVSLYVTDAVTPSTPGLPVVVTGPDTAQLSWAASTDNVGVSGYDVHRSTTAGFTPTGDTVIATVTSPAYLDSNLTKQRYYYRITAADGAGNVSPATAAVVANLGDALAPSIPDGVTTSIVGSTVTLNWAQSTDDVQVVGYDVYRSATSGFTPSSSTLIASTTTATMYVDPGVADGTWYYRVVARDAADNSSLGSPEVAVTLVVNPLTVALTPTADSYVNQSAPATNYGTSWTLSSRGTPGAVSYLRFVLPAAPAGRELTGAVLRARTTTEATAGSIDPHSIRQADNGWTESALTWNTRPALGGVLGTVAADTPVGTGIDTPLTGSSLLPLLNGEATLAIAGNTADSLLLWSSNHSTAGYRPQLLLTFGVLTDTTPPSMPQSLTATLAGPDVNLTWTASTDGPTGYRIYRSSAADFTPGPDTLIGSTGGPTTTFTDSTGGSGTVYYRVIAQDAAGNLSVASVPAGATFPDTTPPTVPGSPSAALISGGVRLDWTASTDDGGVLGYRVYGSTVAGFVPNAENQLGTPTTPGYDHAAPLPGTWRYRISAIDAAGNVSAFTDEFSQQVSDSTPPSVPTGLTHTVVGQSVTLGWSASTDDVGVTGYRVHRSSTPAFTPTAENRIASPTTTGSTDTDVPAGTWYYRVVAVDDAGNTSDPSAQESAVVSEPVIVSVPAVADSYANEGAKTSNFGTSWSLLSRGSVGGVSFIRFVVPTPPDGKTLTGAVLKMRTTTDSAAGSVTQHTISTAADSWTESTVNWNNRPALGTAIGSTPANTEVNTGYRIPLAIAPIQATTGALTLAISGTGTDSLWVWSLNHGIATYRPELILSYS